MPLIPRFTVRIPNIPIFKSKSVPSIADGVFRPILSRSMLSISREAKLLTPVDQGLSRASIFAHVEGGLTSLPPVLRGVTGGSHAIPFLEEGTRPHWPPISALEGWAQRKLGDRSLAFLVARAISRRGTKAIPMFKRSFEKLSPRIIKDFRAGQRKLRDILLGKR
jgi:hypothetical protein